MLLMIFRMTCLPLFVSIHLPPVGFAMQLLDQGHRLYISAWFGGNVFTPLVSVIFGVQAAHHGGLILSSWEPCKHMSHTHASVPVIVQALEHMTV